MLYLIAKALLSGVIIVAASEAAKRSPTYGALEQVRDFPILIGFPSHANSASPLLIVRWGEDHGTSLQPGFA